MCYFESTKVGDYMHIGDRIKKRREQLGMTQEELAQKMGYASRSTVNKVEKGVNDITQTTIVNYAKALGTTPAYLMGWEDTEIIHDTDYIFEAPGDRDFVIEYMRSSEDVKARIRDYAEYMFKKWDEKK